MPAICAPLLTAIVYIIPANSNEIVANISALFQFSRIFSSSGRKTRYGRQCGTISFKFRDGSSFFL
jgi:hypothetical protein